MSSRCLFLLQVDCHQACHGNPTLNAFATIIFFKRFIFVMSAQRLLPKDIAGSASSDREGEMPCPAEPFLIGKLNSSWRNCTRWCPSRARFVFFFSTDFIRNAIALLMLSMSTLLATINPLSFAISVRHLAVVVNWADLFAECKKTTRPFLIVPQCNLHQCLPWNTQSIWDFKFQFTNSLQQWGGGGERNLKERCRIFFLWEKKKNG